MGRNIQRLRFWFVCFCLVLFVPGHVQAKPDVIQKLKGLQVPFVMNEGQMDERVRFYARTFGGTVFVTGNGEIVYSLPKVEGKEKKSAGWVLKEELVGGTVREVTSEGKSPTNVSFFLGKDSSVWRSNISTFDLVNMGEVYEGIELKLKAYGNNVEKIFTVRHGSDPGTIRLRLTGARDIRINEHGELEARTDHGPVTFSSPVAFQTIRGSRVDVPVRYALFDQENTYGFTVSRYDPSHDLVIDPLLQATYLGGTEYTYGDFARAIAIDVYGNVYVAGDTDSSNFPVSGSGAQTSKDGLSTDAFVAKLNPGLTSILQATYLSGSSNQTDRAWAILLDAGGNVYVAGQTYSTNFPGTTGGAQSSYGGNGDAFVAKLNPGLTSILQATYLGGNVEDTAYAIALGSDGNVYASGWTGSTNFPGTIGAAQPSLDGINSDAFVAKLNPGLTSILQATYLGGSGTDYASAIALDAGGNIYVAGDTRSPNFPHTAGGAQPSYLGGTYGSNAFVTKLNPSLTSILQATYLGGNGNNEANAIVLGPGGNVYVAGSTNSAHFPHTTGGAQSSYGGNGDAFVAKLNPGLTSILQATYLGGSSGDAAHAIVLSPGGNVYVAGVTDSTNFPHTLDGAQSSKGGNGDAFVAKLNPGLTSILQATYLGGSITIEGNGNDAASAIALDPWGNVVVAGQTGCTNFPGTAGGAQPSAPKPRYIYNGVGWDAFVAKFDSTLTATGTVPTVNKGDLDGNHVVNLLDAIMAIQVVSDITPAKAYYKEADVNNDGKIGLSEVIYILQKVGGMR